MTPMTASLAEQIASEHSGILAASNDEGTELRFEFPHSHRAHGFYDEMFSRLNGAGVEYDRVRTDDCVILLHL